MFDYSVNFLAIDRVSAKIEKINAKMASMSRKAQQTSGKVQSQLGNMSLKAKLQMNTQAAMAKLKKVEDRIDRIGQGGGNLARKGMANLAAGAASLAPLVGALNQYQQLEQAKGEIQTLGIDEAGIQAITDRAVSFANIYAGVSADAFVRASYDIKSGIESLTDQGVAKFTEMSALTAMATKSSTEQMTKLFAMGYGIFSGEFADDFTFAEQFSSAISGTVQAFRTDGDDLIQGLSAIGAVATKAGVSLDEQLAVMGVSKGAYSTAAQAMTGYRSVIQNIAKAEEKLGMSFTDAEGKMLAMHEVLSRLKKAMDDAGTSIEDQQVALALKQAFGSDEAIKFIAANIDKTEELRRGQEAINAHMERGIELTQQMAIAAQRGKEFELLGQQISNMAISIGEVFAPMALKVSGAIGNIANKIKLWVDMNPELADKIANVAAIVGGLLAGIGALAIVMGIGGMAIGALKPLLVLLTGKFGLLSAASWALNASFWANPITWIIAGVVGITAAVIALIYYWEEITAWVSKLWEAFTGLENVQTGMEIFSQAMTASLDAIGGAFNLLIAPIEFALNLLDTFMSKFNLYNQAKDKIVAVGDSIGDGASSAWGWLKDKAGFSEGGEAQDPVANNSDLGYGLIEVNVRAEPGSSAETSSRSKGAINLSTIASFGGS